MLPLVMVMVEETEWLARGMVAWSVVGMPRPDDPAGGQEQEEG